MKKTEGIMDIRDMLKPYSPDEKIQKMKKIKEDEHQIKGESDAVKANNIVNRHTRNLTAWYPNLKEKK